MKNPIPLLQSFRCRLIVSVVVIEVVMLSILVWNNISLIQVTHTDRLRDTANSMIQQIASTAGNYMVAVDYATLEDYLRDVINYKELLYLAVLDRDNNPVITLGPYPQQGQPQVDTYPALVDDGVFDIAEEIKVAGQPMGKVLTGFSLAIMEDAIDKAKIRGISIAAIEIFLTVLVTVLIGLGLTRRLAVLSSAAAQVESGNYSVTVPIEVDDEVGRTAAAFNRMVAEVFSRSRQLEKAESRSRKLLDENRKLIHTSLQIQEEERKHLARELHDELGQCLTAIQADAELIRDIAGGDKRIVTSAVAIMDVSSRVYDVVHSMMHRLRPSILDNLGLVEALKEEIAAWQQRNAQSECNFEYSGDLAGLDERSSITLYRIVQECLTNISRHADASRVKISLMCNDGALQLTIVDNGRGFDMQSYGRGLGLIGMRERVASLKGELRFDSAPGQGVSIIITVPSVV